MNAEEKKALNELADAGWTNEWGEYNTGGGCMAMERTRSDGTYYLVTDWDGGLPVAGRKAVIGHYDAEGGWMAAWLVPSYSTPEAAHAGTLSGLARINEAGVA